MRRVALAALLLLALSPLAVAQLPVDPCGPLTLSVVGPATAIEPGAKATVSATVANGGQATTLVTLVGEMSNAEWTLDPEEQSVSLPAGGEATLNFTLESTSETRTSAQVTLSGQGDCAPAGLPTGCPNAQACVRQLPSRSVTVDVARESGFRIPGLDALDFPIEYLAAGVLLVGVAIAVPLLIRKRKPSGVHVACPEPLKRVRPGRGTSFPLELGNPTDAAVRLSLEVGAVPEGWSAFLPLPEIQLAARETRSLWLMVRSPADVAAGQGVDIDVTATDAANAQRRRTIKVRAEVDENATEQG